MKFATTLSLVVLALITIGCNSIPIDHSLREEQLTVAKAQSEIKIGMSSSAVVEVLGSPNMVTTDDQRRETWVYDKVSTQVTSSQSQAGVWLVVAGVGQSSSRMSQNQRTLTIIVKFDENNKVRDFAYRSSTF
jgi:outer membrane protein assembly factor BamE (lipoprotein component of BamABCDE complex)